MARKKKGGKKGRGDDDSDDDDNNKQQQQATKEEPDGKKMSRKQKRLEKQQQKQRTKDDDDDDSDDLAALLGGGAKIKDDYGSDDSDDSPPPKQGNNKGGRAAAVDAAAALLSSSEESQEEEDQDPSASSQQEPVGQEQMTMMIDDWGMGEAGGSHKKSKKDKKEKKEKKEKKKEKKEKKSKKDKKESSFDEPAKKSKFELQMEDALKKKEEEESATALQHEEEKKAAEQKNQPSKEEEPDWVEPTPAANDSQVVFGAPDDVVWSDKSQAMRDAENLKADFDPKSLTHGPDGKKLSNKERKRLIKTREAAMRQAEYEANASKASKEGAQFACSQTAVDEKDPQWENSMDVNIPQFSISAAGKILFKDASLTIGRGRHYGLVGPNGRGKSTLLKMIASRDLKLPPRIDFLYVEQEVVADDTPAVEAVLQADARRWQLLKEEKELMEAVDGGDEDMEKIDRLQEVVDELTNMGSDAAEAKARRILYGLGFTMDMQTKPTKMFSGGWRMRISLARALFVEPTLLMLDEPTNHLDLNAVIWLDEYLQKWKKTLLVVSHDQDFLNSVCQEILHIEDFKLASYKGNYDSFKKAEKTKFQQQVKAWEKQEKRLRELKRSGQSKAKAQETVKKNSKREAGARSQKQKNDAVASGTAAAENKELIKRPKEYSVKLEFVEVADLSRPVMEVSNVHFRYSEKHPVIFDNIDFGIDMDSRICIVGPNGAGKSTLLKLLTGELQPTGGDVRRNPRLRMGVYNQHFVDRLPMSKTPVEHLRDRFEGQDYQSVRNRLGRYGLEGHAHEVQMRDLSGGQKARVVFVELSLQEPHILLLDEPTNNLDIETIDALCDAVNEFNGGIVVVTHDQRLIEECDCTLWVVEKLGVTRWDAGFEDYKDNILQQLEEEVEREAQVRKEKLALAAKAKAEKLARLKSKKR